MAEENKTGAATYSQGVNWLVGLSAAVVGAAFLHYADLVRFSTPTRIALLAVVLLFLSATYAGVNYAFWLFHIEEQRAHKERLLKTIRDLAATATEQDTSQNELNAVNGKLKNATPWVRRFHTLLLWSFSLGILISAGVIGYVLIVGVNPETEKKDTRTFGRFAVVQSAVHRVPHGREAHTFLLDQDTGSLWMMVCKQPNEVEFRRVPRVGAGGRDEDATAPSTVPLKASRSE